MRILELVDSHVHLDDASFADDRDAVLARAHAAGVVAQVIPAVDETSWARIETLCNNHRQLYPAYGLHPMYESRHRPTHLQALPARLANPRTVAVGEIGLDFFTDDVDAESQRHYFIEQLKLAREFDLPVIVHARRALEEVTLTLRRIGGLRGVVHSFSGSEEQARQLWQLGFCIGLGGPLTYPRAQRLHRIVATMPIEFLLLESDAPDQPGATHRGERNEPAHIVEVLRSVAELRGEPEATIAAATTANARRLFALPGS